MPQPERFFEKSSGNTRVEVTKTYDSILAREAFTEMDQAARDYLWGWLRIDENYDPKEIPTRDASGGEDFLWGELLDSAREDGNQLSFFVVTETVGGDSQALYVSPDWPSAEAFAKKRLARAV